MCENVRMKHTCMLNICQENHEKEKRRGKGGDGKLKLRKRKHCC